MSHGYTHTTTHTHTHTHTYTQTHTPTHTHSHTRTHTRTHTHTHTDSLLNNVCGASAVDEDKPSLALVVCTCVSLPSPPWLLWYVHVCLCHLCICAMFVSLVSVSLVRAASGGTLAPQPPRATRNQPESTQDARTVHLVQHFFFPRFISG